MTELLLILCNTCICLLYGSAFMDTQLGGVCFVTKAGFLTDLEICKYVSING